jgi:hypothetical protein
MPIKFFMNTIFYYNLRKVIKLLSATLFIIGLAFILLLSSCKKEQPTDIGLNLIKKDLLHAGFIDTATILTHTIKSDSILLPYSISPVLIGTYNDPVFGTTQSSFYGQLAPIGGTISFGKITKSKFDSVVLSLAYKRDTITHGYYGVYYDKQLFTAYELTSPISMDSTYYSSSTKAYNPVALGSKLLKLKTQALEIDSFITKKGKLAPQLRIRLQNLESRFYADSSQLLTKELFLKYFKGVYVKSDLQDNNGAIYAFDPSNGQSKITIYYNDSLKTDFYFYGQARFVNYKQDYTNAPKIKEQLTTADKIQQNEVYTQALGGLRTKIYFPGLATLKNKNIAVNKAELVMRLDPAYYKSYFPPAAAIVAYARDSTGALKSLNIGYAQGIGTYNDKKLEYRVNLSLYIQQILKGNIKDYGVELISDLQYNTPAQMIFGGGGNSTYKMKLELTYTAL